jgi:aminocarboxymuconate-semialdehyde decarboxylase
MPDYWLPWLVGMPAETSLAICSMIFGGIFERLPNFRVAFAHGGGAFPATIGRIEHGWQARPDLVAVHNVHNPKKYLGQFWLDSLVHDKDMLQLVTKLVGVNRVTLGTDYPFPLGEDNPGELIKTSNFTNQEKAIMLGDSALEWLKMDKSFFL